MTIFIRTTLLAVACCALLPASGNAQATQAQLQNTIMQRPDHDLDESLVAYELNRILLGRAKIDRITDELRAELQEERGRQAVPLAIEATRPAVDVALRAPENEAEEEDNEEALATDVEVLAWREASDATEFNSPDIPNLIYEPSRLHDGHFRRAVECINPPEELRAAYSVAIIDGSSLRDALSDSEYLTDFMALAAPASTDPERHGVRVLINLDSGEWEYVLEGEWGDHDRLRQHLGQQLVGRSMETGPHDAHLGVCRIVEFFEDLLEEGNGDLDYFFEGRQIGAKIASLRQHLNRARSDIWDSDIYPIDREAPFFTEDFAPVFQETSRAWTQAAQAHADGQIDEAQEAIDEADKLIDAVREIGDSVVSYRVDRHQFDMRLASLQEQRQDLVKSGLNDDAAIQLYDELNQCQDHLYALHTGLGHGLRLPDIESFHTQTELCLEKSEKLIIPLLEEYEANRWKMIFLYMLGAGLFFALIMRAFFHLRARKLQEMQDISVDEPLNEPDDDEDSVWESTDGW